MDLHIAEEIRALMGRKRISQKQLGEMLGYTQGTMSKRLNGTQSWTVEELDAIAGFFGVGLADLLPLDRDERRGPTPETRNRWTSTDPGSSSDDASAGWGIREIAHAGLS